MCKGAQFFYCQVFIHIDAYSRSEYRSSHPQYHQNTPEAKNFDPSRKIFRKSFVIWVLCGIRIPPKEYFEYHTGISLPLSFLGMSCICYDPTCTFCRLSILVCDIQRRVTPKTTCSFPRTPTALVTRSNPTSKMERRW